MLRNIRPILLALTILGLLASIPLAAQRMATESSSDHVEFVFDYRDLLEVSSYRSKPSEYTLQRLIEMKESGIGSMAIYESTLRELELSGRIQALSSSEAALLTGFEVQANEKSTYVLFLGNASERLIRPLVEESFANLGVEVTPWAYRGLQGVKLAMPKDEASLQAMDPDPITMAELQKLGFHLVVRLSDQRPFQAGQVEQLLNRLAEAGVTRIVFEGGAVTGAREDVEKQSLTAMAQMMNARGIGMAAIELAKPQQGMGKLAYLTNYNIVRLHSLPAALSGLSKDDLADRFALAVQDRNIRMIFLNAEASMDTELGLRKDTIENVLKSMKGQDGAIARIQQDGFSIGVAQPFKSAPLFPAKQAKLPLSALAALGAIALIALMAGTFVPGLSLLVFIAGLAGSAALYKLSPSLLAQGLALGAGIAAPTLAIVYAIRRADEGNALDRASVWAGAWRGIKLLAVTSAISFTGIIFIVGLLHQISYMYVLEQFRGVSLLHLAPIALAFIYLLFFHGQQNLRLVGKRVTAFLGTNITVLWAVAGAVGAMAILYYLSRTGNAGQTSTLERVFRETLQDTLGVRPRTKEFLFAHPLFILGVYLAATARRRIGLLLIAIASIGQLSVVDTFAHLHTPLAISLVRILYGLAFGAVIGVIAAAIWAIAEKGWRIWSRKLEEL